MGQMLQALKNLEARGSLTPRPRSGLARLAEQAAEPASNAAATQVGGPAAPTNGQDQHPVTRIRPRRQSGVNAEPPFPADVVTEAAAAQAEPTAVATVTSTVVDVAWTNPFLSSALNVPPLVLPAIEPIIARPEEPQLARVRVGDARAEPRPQSELPPATRKHTDAPTARPATNLAKPTAAERLVGRTLSDPVRGQALVRLAERLHRDLEQTASKTVLLGGIGSESVTHETLLHIAPLWAERCSGNVLLIDADLPRRALTEALERAQQPGLGELLRGNEAAREFCQPTATERLDFLPSGLALHVDLSSAAARLEQLLEELSEAYDCVLIDGGRTPDHGVSALAPLADATYFVVQLGAVETNTAQAALRELRSLGARVLGSIAT